MSSIKRLSKKTRIIPSCISVFYGAPYIDLRKSDTYLKAY